MSKDMRIVRYFNFLTALKTLLSGANRYARRTGRLLLTEDQIKERLEKGCLPCEHFTGKACTLCGCCGGNQRSFFNKLAYPTETCPATPPRWGPIDE